MIPHMTEAEEALAAWGGGPVPKLVTNRENAVYRMRLTSGIRAALRLHRPGYHSAAEIRSELIWTGALADAGLPVPRPVADSHGEFVHVLSTGRLATVVEWLQGRPFGAAWSPLYGSPSSQADSFRGIGDLLARIHAASDALTLPEGFVRPHWDAEGLLGEQPLWGRFWENPVLGPDEAALMAEARAEARRRLDALAAPDVGLIHADPMRENVLIDAGRMKLIDFDDSGFGYRLYDLGSLMVQNLGELHWPDLLAAAAEGYAALRPLDRASLPLFVALRAFASCGWAVSHLSPGDPRHRDYAARALAQARALLA